MRASSLAWICAVVSSFTCEAAPARAAVERPEMSGAIRVAMMPIGSAVLMPSVRDALDGDLRAALAMVPGVQVQPLNVTQAHIEEAGNNGLDLQKCPLTRDDCALQIGILADVDAVVTFVVEEVGAKDEQLLRGAWLAVDSDLKRHFAGKLTPPKDDQGASLRQFVLRVVTGKGSASKLPFALAVEPAASVVRVDGAPMTLADDKLLWLLPGQHKVHIEAPGRAPVERIVVVNPDGEGNGIVLALSEAVTPVQFYVGIIAAGVGGVVGLGAGTVAAVSEVQLERGQVPFVQRDGWLTAGRVGFGLAIGGACLLGGGAVAAALDSGS